MFLKSYFFGSFYFTFSEDLEKYADDLGIFFTNFSSKSNYQDIHDIGGLFFSGSFWWVVVLNKPHRIEIKNFTFLKMYVGHVSAVLDV